MEQTQTKNTKSSQEIQAPTTQLEEANLRVEMLKYRTEQQIYTQLMFEIQLKAEMAKTKADKIKDLLTSRKSLFEEHYDAKE